MNEKILEAPEDITAAVLNCVVMPNGEVISMGKTIGFVEDFKGELSALQ